VWTKLAPSLATRLERNRNISIATPTNKSTLSASDRSGVKCKLCAFRSIQFPHCLRTTDLHTNSSGSISDLGWRRRVQCRRASRQKIVLYLYFIVFRNYVSVSTSVHDVLDFTLFVKKRTSEWIIDFILWDWELLLYCIYFKRATDSLTTEWGLVCQCQSQSVTESVSITLWLAYLHLHKNLLTKTGTGSECLREWGEWKCDQPLRSVSNSNMPIPPGNLPLRVNQASNTNIFNYY